MGPKQQQPTVSAEAVAEPRTARGVLVAVASLLIPGVGQLIAGAWRRGAVMLAITAVLLIVAWGGMVSPQRTLEALSRPGGLAEVLLGNVALAAFRIYATLDAFRLGSCGVGRSIVADLPRSAAAVGAVVTLAALALVPHALAAHYTLLADSALRSAFAPSEDGSGRSAEGMGPGAEGQESADGLTVEEPGGVNPAEGQLSWLADDDHLTVAVLGSDAAPGRPGDRLDAIMVVSVHPATGRVAVFSVERHLRHVPLPDGLQQPWEHHCRDAAPGWDLLNSLYRCFDEALVDEVAARYPEATDPAASAVADTLGILLGLSIDHYVMVDMAGFVELIDALGGIELESWPTRTGRPEDPNEGCDWRAFDVQPTGRHLDGDAALELVRTRGVFESDRMARQRCLLLTLADQVDSPTMLRRFSELAGVLRRNVATSIPLHEAPALVELLGDVELGEAVLVGFGPPDYLRADGGPHLERIREEVESSLADSSDRSAMPRVAR